MRGWFARHWRKLILIAAGAVSALAGEHTIAKKIADNTPPVVNQVPCTPGEADCTPGK